MTKWLIVQDGVITNVIVSQPSHAAGLGALPYYDGAAIGQPYAAPQAISLDKRLEMLESELFRIKNMYVNNGVNADEMKGENTYAGKLSVGNL